MLTLIVMGAGLTTLNFCSISILNVFSQERVRHKDENLAEDKTKGIVVLEALAATGLRSIRYAKEVEGVKRIVANDFSKNAVENMNSNISDNGVQDIVTASQNDAT